MGDPIFFEFGKNVIAGYGNQKWGQTSLFLYFAFAALDQILFQPII